MTEVSTPQSKQPPGPIGPSSDGAGPARLGERDPEYIRRALPRLQRLFRYFRPEVRGLENVPAEGSALLVGNHSGGFYIVDTFIFVAAFCRHFGPERPLYPLARAFALKVPWGGRILRRFGTIHAEPRNAGVALGGDAAVLVYPGGEWESFRPSWRSSKIDFGRRRGYVRAALEANVPIVPVVSIGGQETALFLTRGARLARLLRIDRLRLKVVPVTIAPPFGICIFDLPLRIPLPAKITIEVLPPIHLRERFGADPDVDHVNGEIVAEMQRALDRLASERRFPVIG